MTKFRMTLKIQLTTTTNLFPLYFHVPSSMYSHTYCIAREWINRIRLPILLVVSYTRKNNSSLSAFAPENLVSRDGFDPVPHQPAHLHTQAESGAYLLDSSRVLRQRPFVYLKPPYTIGSVPSLSDHAIAYQWRSLPRVRRYGASKLQGSSERVLQVTINRPINMRLSFPHPLLLV